MNEKDIPGRVYQDVSEAGMRKAIEASLAALPMHLGRIPGAEIHDTPHLLWVTTGRPIDYNGVFRSILDPLHADRQIDEIKEEFRRRRLPMVWQVGPSSQPADLRQRLLAHGFRHEEDEPGMAADLLALNEDFPTPAGLDIRLVEDIPTLNGWVTAWLVRAPAEVIPPYQKVHAQLWLLPDTPLRYYLGIFQGQTVATAALFFEAGVAALHWVATRPEVRRKGIGTAMTLAALREARRAGYRICILTASSYGEGIYRRIGFREYCTISNYVWSAQDETKTI